MAKKKTISRANDLSCRYASIEMETPRTRSGVEDYLWYLYHGEVRIYIDHKNAWHILVPSRCMQLTAANKCKVEGRQPSFCTRHAHIEAAEMQDLAKELFLTERDLLAYIKRTRPKLFEKLHPDTRAVAGA